MAHIRLSAVVLGILVSLPSVAMGQSSQDIVIYYHTDAIGSVRAITDANGGLLARYDFEPFGIQCGSACGTGTPPETIQFSGKERDPDTALDYFGARYYASETGRFTTVDPVLDIQKALVDPQRWNRYTYVTNNPLRYIDPDGREGVELRQNLLINSYLRGEITRAQLQAGLIGNPSGTQVAIAAAVMTGGAAAELGLLGEAIVWGRGLLTAAVGWALGHPDQAQEITSMVTESIAAPAGFSRPLSVGDLGISGTVGQLRGTFSLRDGAATVSIDMIEGRIQNPFQIVRNIVDTARKAGAKSVRIQGTIANESLYEALRRRYGLRTEGGIDYFDVPIP